MNPQFVLSGFPGEFAPYGELIKDNEPAVRVGDHCRATPRGEAFGASGGVRDRVYFGIEHLPLHRPAAVPGRADGPGDDEISVCVDGDGGVLFVAFRTGNVV